jgi:eukaryotic-like serine/threonine-protein kinase
VLESLGHLHARGWVHRDVKPENIMCFEGRWKLMDLDAAVRAGTQPPIMGTLGYMAPEVVLSQGPVVAETSSDCFSLGILAYELLSGTAVMSV